MTIFQSKVAKLYVTHVSYIKNYRLTFGDLNRSLTRVDLGDFSLA